jgi:SNF2 family DNA or RNA helicase
MKIAMFDGTITLAEIDPLRMEQLRHVGSLRWNRSTHTMQGPVSVGLLESLNRMFRLPRPEADELRRLRAVRGDVERERLAPDPQPIVKYPIKNAELFKHQVRGANMALLTLGRNGSRGGTGFGFFMEMGTGKTITTIAVMGALYLENKIGRVLIAAPTSVCGVWPHELDSFAAFTTQIAVLQGDKPHRLAALAELDADERPGLKIAVINYESTHRDGIFEALHGYGADLIVADESQRIKNHSAAQSKAMQRLADAAPYRLALSGTPVQNNAVDLYSQYRFIDSSVFGCNFYAFRNRYCIMGGYGQHQIVGYRNMDDLVRKEYSIALRVTKEECLDLPEQTFEDRYVTLSKKERAVYDQLRRSSFAELEHGGTITATTVLTKLLRLQQLTGGFLQPDEAARPERSNTAKLDALADILDDYVLETGKKLVIFARFRTEIAAIQALLEGKGIKYGCIYGDIPQRDRGTIVDDFQQNPETKVFLAQLQTAGLGITLHAASVAVFYSLNFNYADYAQALARIHRIGQKNACHYIHLLVEHSVDERVLKILKKKEDIARTIVDDWRSFF